MASHRYLAEHLVMPRFLREKGGAAVLDAIERRDADFFIPVWAEAGFRFSPRLSYESADGLRIGVLTQPTPREPTEAFLAAMVGKADDPAFLRYFLWEKSDTGSMVGEWKDKAHLNHGGGPAFSGILQTDLAAFVARLGEIVRGPKS